MLEKILFFILGSLIGSFLNVCIYRLPLEQSVAKPARSFCPGCKKTIRWFDNIPVISYLILGGKCRDCKVRISLRYPLVELITAGTFLLFYTRYGLSYNFFYYTLFTCGLIVATFVDIAHRIIPDEISVGGIAVGFLLNAFIGLKLKPITYNLKPLLDSLLGILIGGGIIYLTGYLFDLVYFKLLKRPPIQGETESMGGGDVKLLAMIGAFLGWKNAVIAFFLAPFLGLILGIVNLVSKKDHTIPYGPFLSIAALLALFFSYRILGLLIVY